MKRLAVFGFGLVGASIAAAVRKAAPNTELVAIDLPAVVNAGEVRALSDEQIESGDRARIRLVAESADLCVLAAPVSVIAAELPLLLESAQAVTDCGSTKRSICAAIADLPPWQATQASETIVGALIATLGDDYRVADGVAIHVTAIVEDGVVIKPPCIIGPRTFVAAFAYLRGGVWLDGDVIIGRSCEIKSSFIHAGSKTAHFNFVGDSVIGRRVNIEAGAIVANYRNERADKQIVVLIDGQRVEAGVTKFGAFIGDDSRLGANAVTAPGTVLPPGSIVRRLELVDQTG